MYEVEPYVFDGELLDDEYETDAQDCQIAFSRFCTNTNVELRYDQYESDVNNNPDQYIWACPECFDEYCDDI